MRHKYKFKSRQIAEEACKAMEEEKFRYHRLIQALTDGKGKWVDEGDFRVYCWWNNRVPHVGIFHAGLNGHVAQLLSVPDPSAWVKETREWFARFQGSSSEEACAWLRLAERVAFWLKEAA